MNNNGPDVPTHFDKTIGVQENQKIFSYKEKGFWILKFDNQPGSNLSSYITKALRHSQVSH